MNAPDEAPEDAAFALGRREMGHDLRHQQSALLSYLFQGGQNGFREANALAKSPPGVLHADSTDQSGQKPVESCHRRFLLIRGRISFPGPYVSTRKYMGHDESHLRPLLSRETSSDQTRVAQND
jgi:hypothetical protein